MNIFRLNLNRTLYVYYEAGISSITGATTFGKRVIRKLHAGEIVVVLQGPIVENAEEFGVEHWYVVMVESGETGLLSYRPMGESGSLFCQEFKP